MRSHDNFLKTVSEASFLRDVNELVNDALNVCDKRPVQKMSMGLRHDPNFCSLANALGDLGARVSHYYVRFDSEEAAEKIAYVWQTSRRSAHETILPFLLQLYVKCFDLGELSQLVLNSSEALQEEVAT
jgi:hypothetical protein